MKKKLEWFFDFAKKRRRTLLIMKNLVLFLFLLNLQVSASVFSQQRVTLELENATLKECLKAIEKQTDLGFLYNGRELSKIEGINLNAQDEDVSLVLEALLKEQGYAFEINNNVILIKKADVVEVVQVVETRQQAKKITITGTISDDSGEPLPYAAIRIKNTTIGTVSDVNGNYNLQFDEQEIVIIEVSSLGFETAEVIYKGQSTINVTLEASTEGLDEVVVTGYQILSRERATGAFGKMSTEHLEKPATNISERLVGSISGVNSSKRADGSIKFEIRGQTSLLADAQPLVVVDGFPIVQGELTEKDQWGRISSFARVDPFANINPNDVESMTILKDAAAASIWGAKAANGVIVITTKKGKEGKPKVEFSSFWKFGSKMDLDYFDPRATSAETVDYQSRDYDNLKVNNPAFAVYHFPSNVNRAFGPVFTLRNEHFIGNITEQEMNDGLAALSNMNYRNQIEDQLLQNPFTQQYNLSISGGKANFTNALSMMYEGDKQNFKGNEYERVMVNFRNKTAIKDWLDLNFTANMQSKSQERNGVAAYENYVSYPQIKRLQPYDMLVDSDGKLNDLNHLYYYKPIFDTMIPTEQFPYEDWSYNPVQELSQRDFTTKELNARVQLGLDLKLMEGLKFSSKISYEHMIRNEKDIYKENSFTMRRMVNETSSWLTNGGVVTPNMPEGAGMSEVTTKITYYNWRNQLSFNKTFNEKHAFNFVAGTETSQNIIDRTNHADIFGYEYEDRLAVGRLLNPYESSTAMWLGWPITYANYSYPIRLDDLNSYKYNTTRLWSMFANLSYTFNDKYTLSGSFRNDASNIVAPDSKYRYAPFWSAGGTWQISKEDFMSDLNWINRLTLRATIGEGGVSNDLVSYLTLMSVNPVADQYTKETTGSISRFGNPDLRFERTRTINVGLDFAMFGSKLNGSLEVYNKLGTDLIITESLPSVAGASNMDLNKGEMVNKGFEITLGTAIPIVGKDIQWFGNLNFSYNNNEITKMNRTAYHQSELTAGGNRAYSEGLDANTLWSFKYGGEKNYGTEEDPVMVATVIGKDGEHFPMNTWLPGTDAREHMVSEGSLIAPYIAGFRNSFKIYDFNLSFLFTGKFGHEYRRHGFNYTSSPNDLYTEALNAGPDEMVPVFSLDPGAYFYDRYHQEMSYLTASASHIRFQELNLTYNLPRRISSKLGLGMVQVYAQGNNLGTIVWNDYNEDPEYPIGTIKPQATYTLGLRVNL